MKFLDIAVAVMIGISGTASLAAWSPHGGDASATASSRRASLDAALLTVFETIGATRIATLTPDDGCLLFQGIDISPFVASAAIGSVQCDPAPPSGTQVEALVVNFGAEDVTLEAW